MVNIDIAAMRAQLKSNIAAVLTSFEVFDHDRKDKRYPAVTVSWPDTLDPRATQAGQVDLTIPVLVEIVWLGDESADQALMDAMETIVSAIESDRDLNNTCHDLSCAPFQNIGARDLPDGRVVMQFVVPVEILA